MLVFAGDVEHYMLPSVSPVFRQMVSHPLRAFGQKEELHVRTLPDDIPGFIVNGPLVCRIRALEQAVVALRIEEPLFVKACLLETVIHVGGDHEIILILYQRIQVLINGSRRIHVTVHVNISCPESPPGLCVRIRIESAGIHIPYAKTRGEV